MALSQMTKNTKSAAPAPAEAAPVQAAVPDTQALSLLPETQAVTVADALNAALSAGSDSAISAFPIITQTTGPQGGQVAPADFLPQEVQDTLPSGKRPINCVYMGYRLSVSAWALGYNDSAAQAASSKDAGKAKPVYAASVSPNDTAATALVMKAGRNYQFTKSADKSKFDYATSKAGHVKVQVELMVYLPDINDVVVLSAASGYGNTEATLKSIAKLVDPKTGQLGVFPASVRPLTEDKSSKSGFSWKQHSLDVTTNLTQDGAAALQAFNAWKTVIMSDAGKVQAVRDWLSGSDRRMTSDITAALTAAASL
jgi:hypothetical protein